MRITDRFIYFTAWPTSRKSVLIFGMTTLAMLAAWLVAHFLLATTGTINLALLDPFLGFWTLAFLLGTLSTLPAIWAGRDARWTAYLFVFLNGPLITGAMYLLGTMSSPLAALFPALLVQWLLYFDEKVCAVAFVWMLVLLVAVAVLEYTGLLPFAPILLDRSVDSHQGMIWFISFLFVIGMLTTLCFFVGLLVVWATQEQAQRLKQAHQALEKSAGLLERSNRLISRYVPAQLAEHILAGGHGEQLKPERRKLVIFFSDVPAFSEAVDEMDPEELVHLLNEYLSEMVAIADRHGATVNQMIGDSIMIFFGAPQATNDRDHAQRAVRMAQDMHRRMQDLRQAWLKRGISRPFAIRIGINAGYASVGDYGSERYKLYSAIGVQTNLTARLQSQCEPGRVLLSHTVWALVENDVPCTPKGEIQVKGIRHPVLVYEVD